MKPVTVESLSSPGCHNCKAFEEYFETIKSHFPNVTYRNISILSPEGMEMAAKYSIFASPGIVINGELFSTGGIDKDKFLEKIKQSSQ